MSDQWPDGERPAYLALPPSGSGPGIAVFHPWWGLNDWVRRFADRLATTGFVVAAPDLYGDGRSVSTIDEAQARLESMDGIVAAQRAFGAIDFLLGYPAATGPSVGAVGFSMGGSWAVQLSGQRPQLAAVALYYGSGSADWPAARASYLGHFAAGDEWEPDDEVQAMEQAMRSAGRPTEFWTYQAGHWFAEDDRPDNYDAEAAELAWQRTVEFLRRELGEWQIGE